MAAHNRPRYLAVVASALILGLAACEASPSPSATVNANQPGSSSADVDDSLECCGGMDPQAAASVPLTRRTRAPAIGDRVI